MILKVYRDDVEEKNKRHRMKVEDEDLERGLRGRIRGTGIIHAAGGGPWVPA